MTGREMQTKFCRDLELRYADHVARLVADGVDAEAAHELAMEDVRTFSRAVLHLLTARGLFPWPTGESTPSGLTPSQRAMLEAHRWEAAPDAPPFPDLMEHIAIMKEFRRRKERQAEFADATASAPQDAELSQETPPPEQLDILNENIDWEEAMGHA